MHVVTEPNDVEIIPLNSLDTINSLFPYTDENKLNDEPNNDQQTETVTDFNEDNGSTASDVDKNQPIEISTNGNDENSSNQINKKTHSNRIINSSSVEENDALPSDEGHNIDDDDVQAAVNILNSIDQNRNDVEDPEYIPETNDDDSGEPSSKSNGRPKKGRKRKFIDQNSQIRKKKSEHQSELLQCERKKSLCKGV